MIDESKSSNQNTLTDSIGLNDKFFSAFISGFKTLCRAVFNCFYLLGLRAAQVSNLVSNLISEYFFVKIEKFYRIFKIRFSKWLGLSREYVSERILSLQIFLIRLRMIHRDLKKSKESLEIKGIRENVLFIWSFLRDRVKVQKSQIDRFMNYVYPALGVGILVVSISVVSNFKYGLSVDCLGRNIGYVEDEYVFLDASKQMNSRIHYVGDQELINDTPRFTLVRLKNSDKLKEKEKVADDLLKASNKMICKATGLYIDDEFIGAVRSEKELKGVINDYLKPWQEKYQGATVGFVENVSLKRGYYLVDSLCKIDHISDVIASEKEGAVNYTVRAGDTPMMIAVDNKVPYEQLKNLNPGIEEELKPGQQVVVSAKRPRISVKVEQTETFEEDIPFTVEVRKDDNFSSSYQKTIQSGNNGRVRKTYKKTIIDGQEINEESIGEEIISPVINEILVVGTKSSQWKSYCEDNEGYQGGLLYPVPGGRISCGWQGYRGHVGIDISAPRGSTIKVAGAGKVIFSGWQKSYGNCVIVDHGNGVVTKYAHNSANVVSAGDYVTAGQKIAEVGQTGNATGNHCHFEVVVNGIPKNPANYIGK